LFRVRERGQSTFMPFPSVMGGAAEKRRRGVEEAKGLYGDRGEMIRFSWGRGLVGREKRRIKMVGRGKGLLSGPRIEKIRKWPRKRGYIFIGR